MWLPRVWRGLIVACVIGCVALGGLVLGASTLGRALFADRPVLTFITYENSGQATYRLGVLDVAGNRLLVRPQPAPALVLAQDAGGAPAIVAASYKQREIVLTVYDAANGGQRLLTTDAGNGSSWDPANRYYAFETRDRHWKIVVMDTLTGQRVTLTDGLGNARLPIWWP